MDQRTAPCAEYLTSLNAGNPGDYYGTGIKWPDGTYTHVPLPQTNPVTVAVPAGMITGTAYVFLAKDPNAVPVESSVLSGCEMKFEVVAPLPSPMISAESIVVGAALVALVGGGLMTSRRRRFAHVAG